MSLFAPNFGLSTLKTGQPVINLPACRQPGGGLGYSLVRLTAQTFDLSGLHLRWVAPLAAGVDKKFPFIQLNQVTPQPLGLYFALAAQFCFLPQRLRVWPALVCLPVKSN
jgi:hypothetical protein